MNNKRTMDGRFSTGRLANLGSGGMALVIALFFALFICGEARAATITVGNLNDSGAGSLRQAIADASAGDTINFSVTGTITLTSGNLSIGKNIDITGPGASNLTISGNNASGIFSLTSGTVTISGLTMKSGSAVGGGAIFSSGGAFTVSACTFTGNSASDGGAIYVFPGVTASIVNSTLSINSASDIGGGVYNKGTLTITNSTISGNSGPHDGGGVYNKGTLTITNSTISGNSATLFGGGIENDGSLTITGSTISGNSATAPGDSEGGGILNTGSAILKITSSTISGNSAGYNGGGILNGGVATITSSTISGNTAPYGGGIYHKNAGTFAVTSSTISGNSADSGGGCYTFLIPIAINNTIIADNSATNIAPDCIGNITSNDYNLIEVTSSCTISGSTAHNIYNLDPVLGPLQNNGGPTFTHALLTGSPVIDRGNCAAGTDQRGLARPIGASCDIGAYEVSSTHTLTINKSGAGTGTITSDISGIDCGGTCSASFGDGALLTLTASPAAGSVFDGWSGGSGSSSGCTGTETCTFDLSSASAVTANFKLLQSALTLNAGSPLTYNTSEALSVTGGSGAGTVTYQVTAGSCTVLGNQLTANSGTGSCEITAAKAADTNYVQATATATVALQKAAQAALTVNASTPLIFNSSETLSTSGGSGTGNVSYQVTSGSCTVLGDQLTAASGTGSCSITATKAPDTNYLQATAIATITLQKAAQTITITQHMPADAASGASFTVAAESDSGLAVVITTSGSCNGNASGTATITITSDSGACTVHYDQPGDANYHAAGLTENTTAHPTHVVISAATGNGNITLDVTSPNCWFTSYGAKTETQIGSDPFYTYPHGLVEFTVNCAQADVTITFPGDISGTTYRKYGPTTPGSPATVAWYDFNNVTTNGSTSITLHLIDGQLGDDTAVDGTIVDAGGPAVAVQGTVAVPTLNEWGMLLFLLFAGALSVRAMMRKQS